MRLIKCGSKDGQSCVVEEIDCSPTPGALSVKPVYDVVPGDLPPRPAGKGAYEPMPIAPGAAHWFRVYFPPSEIMAMDRMHHTDSVDCLTIVTGSVDLILDDGAHRLEPGDSAIVAGVDHAWKAGPDGCVISSFIFGTPARADESGDAAGPSAVTWVDGGIGG